MPSASSRGVPSSCYSPVGVSSFLSYLSGRLLDPGGLLDDRASVEARHADESRRNAWTTFGNSWRDFRRLTCACRDDDGDDDDADTRRRRRRRRCVCGVRFGTETDGKQSDEAKVYWCPPTGDDDDGGDREEEGEEEGRGLDVDDAIADEVALLVTVLRTRHASVETAIRVRDVRKNILGDFKNAKCDDLTVLVLIRALVLAGALRTTNRVT